MAKRFTAGVVSPARLEVSDEANIARNWKRFKRDWENYFIASRLKEETNEALKCAVFKTVIGPEAMDMYDGFQFNNPGEEKKLAIVLAKFEEHCEEN